MEGKLFTHFKFSSLSPVLPDNGRNQELPYEWQLPLTSLFKDWETRKIINTPSGILFSCVKTVRPPGIDALLIRIKIPERIDKAIL